MVRTRFKDVAVLHVVLFLLLQSCFQSYGFGPVQQRTFFTRSPKVHSSSTHVLMSSREMDMNAVPVEILSMLHDQFKSEKGLVDLLPELLSACRSIGTALRDGMFTADKTGTENPFGDQQLDVDVRSDKVDAFSLLLFQYYSARHDSNYLKHFNYICFR
jgi:hypothetical protein